MDIISNKSFIQYECDKCGKILTTLGGFKTHKKRHLEIKPYGEKLHECSICTQKFYTKGSLDMHKKVHKIQQSHTCNICTKVFSTQRGLNIHANVHRTYIENIATPTPNIEEYFPITLLLNTNNLDNELSPDWIEHL
jgi:KRAB domain-containing zinc finger protein